MQLAVPGKRIGFANVTYYGIYSFGPVGIADIFNMMISLIEHRPNEVVETAVHTGKYGSWGLFYHIRFYYKVTTLAYQVFTGFKPYLQFFTGFFFKVLERNGHFLAKGSYICFRIIRLVRHFEPTAQVNKLQVGEVVK